MAKLSSEKRNRLILVLVGGLVLSTGIWYGVIKTRNAQLGQSKGKLEAAKDKLEKAKRRVGQAEQVEAALEVALKKLEVMEDGMAPGTDLFSWSYALLEKAKAGQDVEIIEVTRPLTNEVGVLAAFPYMAATFTVRGVAHYHDYGKFLADFENRFPYFRAQNMSLGATPETGSEVTTRGSREKLFFRMDIVALIRPTK